MPTYKKEYSTLVEDIMTDCDIYSADGHKFHTERALWDTGADTTIISSRIVTELALQPYKAGGISGIGGATGYFLGHSNNLIILSLRRSPIGEVTTPFILRAGRPRQYTAFHAFRNGMHHYYISYQ